MQSTTSRFTRSYRLLSAVAVVAAVALAGPAAHANLVTNGGFETGTFSGWTVNDEGDIAIGAVGNPNVIGDTSDNGSYVAVFNPDNSAPNAVLSQSIPTIAGANYTVSFDYGSNGGPQSIYVSASDENVGLLNLLFDTSTNTGNNLVTSTFSFQAASAATTIAITDYFDNDTYSSDGFLDNVTVTGAPEPTSLVLLATGLAGAALTRRRKTV
ncbi:MAG TPA: PEP-CTERM sorting domain-containing protein [Acetobacteraceae bacterium]|jgi:hypothetical protein